MWREQRTTMTRSSASPRLDARLPFPFGSIFLQTLPYRQQTRKFEKKKNIALYRKARASETAGASIVNPLFTRLPILRFTNRWRQQSVELYRPFAYEEKRCFMFSTNCFVGIHVRQMRVRRVRFQKERRTKCKGKPKQRCPRYARRTHWFAFVYAQRRAGKAMARKQKGKKRKRVLVHESLKFKVLMMFETMAIFTCSNTTVLPLWYAKRIQSLLGR